MYPKICPNAPTEDPMVLIIMSQMVYWLTEDNKDGTDNTCSDKQYSPHREYDGGYGDFPYQQVARVQQWRATAQKTIVHVEQVARSAVYPDHRRKTKS